MTLPMAAWRVTYTPGNWLVLAGPTMLVVMLPAPARASKLINDLWADIVAAESVDGLLKLVGEVGLDAMPDFGAFFWDAKGLHGLTRGGVRVVDTDTAEVALEGSGSITWNEAELGGERHLRVDLEPVNDDEVLQLPLVVGAASVSAIYLTTDAQSLVRFPSYEQLGVLPKLPVLGVRPRQRDLGAVAPAAVLDESQPAAIDATSIGDDLEPIAEPEPIEEQVPEVEAAEADAVAPELDEAVAPEQVDEPALTEEPLDQPASAAEAEPLPEPAFGLDHPTETEALSEPILDDLEEEVQPFPGLGDEIGPNDSTDPSGAIAPPVAPIVSAPPVAPVIAPPVAGPPIGPGAPEAGSQRQAPVVIPPSLGEVDDDAGGTIFSTGLAATHKPAPQTEQRQAPQVMAAPCAQGHPNAPGTRFCRICQSPVDSTNARLIQRPRLASVRTNYGEGHDIVDGILIGRAPDSSKGPNGAFLLRVSSPSSDISRNHLLVVTQGWAVHVTDLNSTNGTLVLPVGETPFPLRDGASAQVEIGTVLDLGDGVSLRIEPPLA